MLVSVFVFVGLVCFVLFVLVWLFFGFVVLFWLVDWLVGWFVSGPKGLHHEGSTSYPRQQ